MAVKHSNSNKFQYPSLNGLRAISILFVIFYHLELNYKIFDKIYQSDLKFLGPIVSLIMDGQLGVNIFFVISGFLITSLLLEENKRKQTISLRNFYIRRTIRIFPAYYFFLLVLFVLQIIGIVHIGLSSWLTSITYTKYFNWHSDWFTAHAWSLSIEEQFYLFYPLIFKLGDKTRKTTAFCLVLIVPVIKLFLSYHPVAWMNELTIFQRIDAIAIGCLIAFYKEELLQIFKSHFQKLFYFSFLGIFLLQHLQVINIKLPLHLNFFIMLFGSTSGTIANIFIAIIILYSVFGHRGLWFRLLNTRMLNYIGLLSYSLYLWQQVFISGLKYLITSFPQNVLFVFATAMFSYNCIEKPFLRLKQRFQKIRGEMPVSGFAGSLAE